MKKKVIFLLVLMQFISCNTTKKNDFADENCSIILNSVNSVIYLGEKRDAYLDQLIDEVKNGKKTDAKNVSEIQKLEKEINKTLTENLKILKIEFAKNKSEKVFDVTIQYLTKVQELERQFPKFVSDLSDNDPENNSRFSASIKKASEEVIKFYGLYRDAMQKYLEVHNINEKRFDLIQKAVDRNIKQK
jgi:hypothetical protein